MDTKELILATVDDLVADFLYYGRKNDEELSVEQLGSALDSGDVTIVELVDRFRTALTEALQ